MCTAELKLYDLKTLSLHLNLTPDTLRRFCREGLLKSFLVGKKYMVSQYQLDEYLNSRNGKRSQAGRPARADM